MKAPEYETLTTTMLTWHPGVFNLILEAVEMRRAGESLGVQFEIWRGPHPSTDSDDKTLSSAEENREPA